MTVKFNTEFNYRYQCIGETPWEKIKTLQGFLEGRVRAASQEKVSAMRYQAKLLEIEHAKSSGALPHVLMNLEAELLEIESFKVNEEQMWALNREEIAMIERLLAELYEIVEPTRLKHEDGTPYTDEEMFEINAPNEFTAMIGKEILGDMVAFGRPSAAKLKNAMSNPYTFNALKNCGLLPPSLEMVEANADPTKIELAFRKFNDLDLTKGMKIAWHPSVEKIEHTKIVDDNFYRLEQK